MTAESYDTPIVLQRIYVHSSHTRSRVEDYIGGHRALTDVLPANGYKLQGPYLQIGRLGGILCRWLWAGMPLSPGGGVCGHPMRREETSVKCPIAYS